LVCGAGSVGSGLRRRFAAFEHPGALGLRRWSSEPEITSIALGDLRSWQSPLDVAASADAVWVTVHELGLVRVDPATNRVVATVPGDYFFRVPVGPDAVWVSTGGDGRVVRIDPSSNGRDGIDTNGRRTGG
jgi:streptogramin lyase